MILRITMAMAAACPAILAQEPTSPPDVVPAADSSPKSAATVDGDTTGDDTQLTVSGPNAYLKVYAFDASDPLDVMEKLTAMQLPGMKVIGVQGNNDAAENHEVHIVATKSQHEGVALLIQNLEAKTEISPAPDKSDQQQKTRTFKVSVALIKNDWQEQLSEDEHFSSELKELYEDVDFSALGGDLQQAAPALLFPERHAAVFSVSDISKLTGLLTRLGLQKEVSVTEQPTEELAQYSFESFDVPELSIPIRPTPSARNYGPFAKLTGAWTLGIGGATSNENSVICVRHYAQFVETEWPTRIKHVERRQVDSNHFGNRFDLNRGEVAVLRFWAAGQRFSRGIAPGMSSAMMGVGGLGTPSGGGMSGLNDAKDKFGSGDSSFAVIIVGYADDLKPDADVDPGWSKPLKTTALKTFDYDAARRYSRKPAAASRYGFNDFRAAAAARTSGQPAASAGNNAKSTEVSFIVYTLRNVQAAEASKLVQQLFPAETGFRVATDDRTNSLLISASDENHTQLRDVLQVLDGDGPQDNVSKPAEPRKTNGTSVEMEIGPADTVILKGSKENVAAAEQMLKQMSSQQLLDRSTTLQNKAMARAEHYLKSGSAKKDLEALKQTVQEDFDVRQKLQLAEIEFLKARLVDLERRVRQKEKLKDRIIERRIESLLLDPAEVEQKNATEALKRAEAKFKRVEPTDPFTVR